MSREGGCEIWCCTWCTWSVVYFFQESWKCCRKGGGGGGGPGKIVKQLSWIELLSIWKATLTPGKMRWVESILVSSLFKGSFKTARDLDSTYCFVFRARAVLSLPFLFSEFKFKRSKCCQQSCTALNVAVSCFRAVFYFVCCSWSDENIVFYWTVELQAEKQLNWCTNMFLAMLNLVWTLCWHHFTVCSWGTPNIWSYVLFLLLHNQTA